MLWLLLKFFCGLHTFKYLCCKRPVSVTLEHKNDQIKGNQEVHGAPLGSSTRPASHLRWCGAGHGVAGLRAQVEGWGCGSCGSHSMAGLTACTVRQSSWLIAHAARWLAAACYLLMAGLGPRQLGRSESCMISCAGPLVAYKILQN